MEKRRKILVLRCLAKLLDLIFLGSVPLYLGFLGGFVFVEYLGILTLAILLPVLSLIGESLSLLAFKTTPGKYILGLKFAAARGSPSRGILVYRLFQTWVVGLGAGVPVLGYMMGFWSLFKYSRGEDFWWDRQTEIRVAAKSSRINWGMKIIGLVAYSCAMVWIGRSVMGLRTLEIPAPASVKKVEANNTQGSREWQNPVTRIKMVLPKTMILDKVSSKQELGVFRFRGLSAPLVRFYHHRYDQELDMDDYLRAIRLANGIELGLLDRTYQVSASSKDRSSIYSLKGKVRRDGQAFHVELKAWTNDHLNFWNTSFWTPYQYPEVGIDDRPIVETLRKTTMFAH